MTSHDFPSKRCHIYLVFNETGCKITAFFWIDQIIGAFFTKNSLSRYPCATFALE